MATTNSHTYPIPSIPTTLAEAHARIRQLEDANLRLHHNLSSMLSQITMLEAGKYLVTDDGDWSGPFSGDISKMVRDYTEEGATCTVVQVIARHEGQTAQEDFGVTAGIDYPLTLAPAACW